MRRARTYTLYRKTKNQFLNISTSLILVVSSLGGAVPLFITNTADAAGTPGSVKNARTNETFDTIQAAIDDSDTQAGDTIDINEDLTVSSQVTINKQVTLDGQDHTISVSGTQHILAIESNGTTVENLKVTKTDNTAQNIIYIHGSDVVINNVNVSGQYLTLPGNTATARGLEVSGDNFLVENSSFTNLRQPAYINGFTGTLKNNEAAVTRGWVVVGNSNVTFLGNTWNNNDPADIAIIDDDGNASTPATNNYPCSVMAQIRSDNNDPTIDNQLLTSACDTTAPSTPSLLSPVDRGYTKTNDFTFDWADSIDDSSVTYEFQSSQNPHTTNGVLDTGVWDNIVNGNSEQKNLTTSEIHSTGAQDGVWYWQVRAIDAAGNKSTWTNVWHVTIDTHAPASTLDVQNLNNGYVNTLQHGDKLTIIGHATDNLGMSRVLVQLLTSKHGAIENHTVYLSGTDQNWSTDFDAKQLGLTQGQYSVVATVTDNAGNTYRTSYLDFTLDNTKPTVEFANPSPADGAWENDNFDVTFNAHDNNKLNYVNVALRDNTKPVNQQWQAGCHFGNLNQGDVTETCNIKLPAGLPDGTYTVQIGGQDQAGLWTVNATRTVKIQRAAPVQPTSLKVRYQYDGAFLDNGSTVWQKSKPGPYKGNNLELTWSDTAGDWVTGHHVLVTFPDGKSKVVFQGPNTNNWLLSQDEFAAHGNGTYTFSVVANNPNGASIPSDIFTLYYDTQSPEAWFTDSSYNQKVTPSQYVNGNFWVYATASDNVALNDAFFDVRDANGWIAGCMPGTFSSTPATIKGSESVNLKCQINTSKLVDGQTYTLRVHASDMTAHYGGGENAPLTIDTSAPEAPTIKYPKDGSSFNSTPIQNSWTAVTNDVNGNPDVSGIDHYQVAYIYDDGHTFGGSTCAGEQIGGQDVSGCRDAYGTSRNHVPNSGEQGGVTIYVRAIDKAGNVGNWSTPVHYTYDSVNPTLKVDEPTGDKTISLANDGYATSGTVTDPSPSSDVNRVVLYVTDSHGDRAFRDVAKTFPNGEWSIQVPQGALADGTYTFNFTAYDNANNHNKTVRYTITVDSSAPLVTDDLTVNMLTGDKATLSPTVTDASPVTYQWQVSDSKLLNDPQDTLDGSTLNIGPAPKGNYTVTLTVTDQWGNATTVTYDVTISTPNQNPQFSQSNIQGPQTPTGPGGRGGGSTDGTIQGSQGPQSDTVTPDHAVLGASTTKGSQDSDGQVKGDSTVNTENTNDKKSTNFMGLGWWWLLVLAAIIALVYLAAGRNSRSKDAS